MYTHKVRYDEPKKRLHVLTKRSTRLYSRGAELLALLQPKKLAQRQIAFFLCLRASQARLQDDRR